MRFGMGMGLGLGAQRRALFNPALYTWVDNTYAGETADGTFDHPYKTMAAAEAANPALTGDKATIYVKAGTYAEDNTYVKAYTWKNYGIVILKAGNATLGAIKVGGACASIFDGFILDGDLGSGTYSTSLVYCNTAVYDTSAKITLRNCTLRNPKETGYGIHYTTYGGGAALHNGLTIEVSGCTFTGNCRSWIYNGTTIGQQRQNIITANNCTFIGSCPYSTISIGATDGDNGTAYDTVSITGCSFTKNKAGNDILIAKSCDATITDNTFTWAENSDRFAQVIKAGRSLTAYAGIIGAITFNNNTLVLGNYTIYDSNLIDLGEQTLYDIECKNNVISGLGTVTGTCRVIASRNQNSFACENNSISFPAATTLNSVINYSQPTVTPDTPASIKNNTIIAGNTAGYVILVGRDVPDTNNNLANGVVVAGNLIYGAYYCGTGAGTAHTIFIGYTQDAIIRHNVIIGCNYGLIMEHDNATTAAATTAIHNNIVIDTYAPIIAGGLNNLRAYNNTIINRIAGFPLVTLKWNDTMGIEWDAENPTPNTGLEFKNNIVYTTTSNNFPLIKLMSACMIDAAYHPVSFAEGGCDYNLLYSNTPNKIAQSGADIKTIAQWIALGYDANSIWNEGACVAPQLTDIAALMDLVNVDPIAGSNVIGAGANLGTSFDDAILSGSTPPITSAETDTQPEEGAWTIGAVIRSS